jgi:hypothetical protein
MKLLMMLTILILGCSKNETTLAPKIEVECPAQSARTAVFFAFGQSNSTNTGERLYENSDPRILNYFQGHCYIAADPMLGSIEGAGSVWIPLSQRLLAAGTYDQVILISSGVSGSSVQQWAPGGDLSDRYLGRLQDAKNQYTITNFLWHQGESNVGTATMVYENLLGQIISEAFQSSPTAKFYVSITSKCGVDVDHPEVTDAQRAMVNGTNIFQGPDTDTGIPLSMRKPDHCHMSAAAQEVFADLWFAAL